MRPVVMIHRSTSCIVLLRHDVQKNDLTVHESGNITEIVGEKGGQGE